MKDLWERLEAHATKHGRSLRLRPGATEKAVSDAERVIGRPFPADFRASVLAHDGQEPGEGDETPFEFLPGCSPLAPVAAIAANWKDEQDYAQAASGDHTPEILNTLKHPLRIAIAGTPWWDGDNTYLDLTPAAAGTVGQVITFTSECDMSLLGPSFRGALEAYLDALDQRAWNYSADKKHVIGPEGFEDGNLSWNWGEWIASSGKNHDANSGTHEPFDGALPAAGEEPATDADDAEGEAPVAADADADAADGDAADGDAADGDAADGDAADGDAADGDAGDGDATDGDAADGDVVDGDGADVAPASADDDDAEHEITPASSRKAAVKKPAARKPTTKKPAAKTPVAKKPAAKKPIAKKPAAKKATATKAPVRKPSAKKATAKKATAKKATAKKATAKKATAKKSPVKKPAAKKLAAKKRR